MSVSDIFSIIIPFTWLGLISAISFIEAPVKFKAPGVTLPVGLSIGKRVFNALNKTEWGLLAILLCCLFFRDKTTGRQYSFFAIAAVILLLQTCWLLPVLDRRAGQIIGGQKLPRSYLHYYYVSGELIKMISLFFYGWLQLNRLN